jgi:hypothetical protein
MKPVSKLNSTTTYSNLTTRISGQTLEGSSLPLLSPPFAWPLPFFPSGDLAGSERGRVPPFL